MVKNKITEHEAVGSSLTCWAYTYVSWCDVTTGFQQEELLWHDTRGLYTHAHI